MASPKKRPTAAKKGKLPKGNGVKVTVIDRKDGKVNDSKTVKVRTNNTMNKVLTSKLKSQPSKKGHIKYTKDAAKRAEKQGLSTAKDYRDAAKTLMKTK